MKKTSLKLALLLLILALILVAFLILKPRITGNSINQQMFTKAICDNNNYCEDYEVICNQKQVKSFTPTGMVAQNSDNWNDSRTPEQIEEMCG